MEFLDNNWLIVWAVTVLLVAFCGAKIMIAILKDDDDN